MAEVQFDYIRDLVHAAARDEKIRNDIASDPVGALTRYSIGTSMSDSIQLFTIPILALIVAIVLAFAWWSAANGKTVPAEIVNLAASALGGLVGLKASHH
jgi:hypothetical protein